MNILRFLIFLFTFTFLFGIVLVQGIIQHEFLHQLIFKEYGIDSTVTYNFKQIFADVFDITPDMDGSSALAWTTPDSKSYGNCTENCQVLHSQVEISDSQTNTIILTLFIVLILYIFYKELNYGIQEIKDIRYNDFEDEYPRFNIQ